MVCVPVIHGLIQITKDPAFDGEVCLMEGNFN